MDSSTLVLTENVINPDGSRARTKVTLLNGLVSLLVRINSGRSRNFRGSYSERRRLGPRPKLLYVLMAAALSARSGLSSRLGLLFGRWQVP
jgi:hypothetical protein